MPKTYITRQEKLNNDLCAYIYGAMKIRRISQSDMARQLGIKQPSLNYKLRHGNFSFEDLTAIFEVLQPDAQTVMRLVGAEQWKGE